MKRLTEQEFITMIIIANNQILHNGLRVGQAYMNALCEVMKDLYQEITASDIDPYHNDDKLNAFLDRVRPEQ